MVKKNCKRNKLLISFLSLLHGIIDLWIKWKVVQPFSAFPHPSPDPSPPPLSPDPLQLLVAVNVYFLPFRPLFIHLGLAKVPSTNRILWKLTENSLTNGKSSQQFQHIREKKLNEWKKLFIQGKKSFNNWKMDNVFKKKAKFLKRTLTKWTCALHWLNFKKTEWKKRVSIPSPIYYTYYIIQYYYILSLDFYSDPYAKLCILYRRGDMIDYWGKRV